MKKLICYLSVIALMVMTTGCKDHNADVSEGDQAINDGDENILFSYHTLAQGLCGGSVFNANTQLNNYGFTQISTGNYTLVDDNCVVNITFQDVDSNELIEVMDITFTPSDLSTTPVLTFDCIKAFVTLTDYNVKLFSNYTYCSFYGFQTANGEWMALDNYNELFREVTEDMIDGGKYYWVDDNITDFYLTESADRTFTGMYLFPTKITPEEEESTNEYIIQINYTINQPY